MNPRLLYGWQPYVSMAARRAQAARLTQRLTRSGRSLEPVKVTGRVIARSYWGRAWCDNLLAYSDFANRLPRGERYARNGSVIDLRVGPGLIEALVSGSMIYEVGIRIRPLPGGRWKTLVRRCAGSIGSVVELLRGRISQAVMEIIARPEDGLFPAPRAITMTCSCPDVAVMCKHVAAVLYGVGARLDERPELLFRLRAVDGKDLIARAGKDLPLARKGPAAAKILGEGDISAIFGLEMVEGKTPGSRAAAKKAKLRSPKPPADTKDRTAPATSRQADPRGASGGRDRANVSVRKKRAAKR